MKNHHNNEPFKVAANMLNQKTFEDFNNVEPDPNDPDFKDPKPMFTLPFVIDDGEEFTSDDTKGIEKNEPDVKYNYKYTSDEYNYLRD